MIEFKAKVRFKGEAKGRTRLVVGAETNIEPGRIPSLLHTSRSPLGSVFSSDAGSSPSDVALVH